VKHSEIEPGRTYLLATVIGAGPRTPRIKAHTRARVIAVDGAQRVTVEVPEPVCVNADEFPPEQIAWAMVNGKLRYEQRPAKRTVRAADVVAPIEPATGVAG
jgi:hypothetical protein